jgi:hypothetical protein
MDSFYVSGKNEVFAVSTSKEEFADKECSLNEEKSSICQQHKAVISNTKKVFFNHMGLQLGM